MPDFSAKMQQIQFRLGIHPRPHWESLQHSPDPVAGWAGFLSPRTPPRPIRPLHFWPQSSRKIDASDIECEFLNRIPSQFEFCWAYILGLYDRIFAFDFILHVRLLCVLNSLFVASDIHCFGLTLVVTAYLSVMLSVMILSINSKYPLPTACSRYRLVGNETVWNRIRFEASKVNVVSV